MAKVKSSSFLISLLIISLTSLAQSSDECVYTIYIRTGKIIKGGTDSIISLALSDTEGKTVQIDNLEAWGGLMEPGHDYYERGNLDIFSGRGPCFAAPPCCMNLTSDGTGPQHGWYCNYVEVTYTGAHVPCKQQLFTVEQWLARDAWPYQLTTVRDYCTAAEYGVEYGSHGQRDLDLGRKGSLLSGVPNALLSGFPSA